MTILHDDPRVRAAMPVQLAERDALLATGATQIGWKLGFGAPAALENLGIESPLVAFMTNRGLVPSGGRLDISRCERPLLEPEIAVHLGSDLAGDVSARAARAAIEGFGAAIEVIDLPAKPGDVGEILERAIFHRAVVLGSLESGVPPEDLHQLAVWVEKSGERAAGTDDPTTLPGDPVELVRHVARYLAAFGEGLRAGEVVIMGAVVPAIPVAPGDSISVQIELLGEVTLDF